MTNHTSLSGGGKHTHKRMKGFQICRCGEYVGLPVEYKWLYQIKGWKNMSFKEIIFELFYMAKSKLK
jgi:hypothetical protein